MPENIIIPISSEVLLEEVLKMKGSCCRLVQICATRIPDGYELSYSFGKDFDLYTLRFNIGEEVEIPSISGIYPASFLYENEIHDLFGVPIKMISLDYKGTLYRTEKKTPFK
ncbi:MAG: NADH-quinone oxidoreductase subunit C [Ruminococcaceae bacterium]|jgi:NADH:ubiquinone oxidoreductase 27 kD subunit|nr:NADH-quinone oxidoreductase subunit C [Oscillospiraceae bacterium]